MPNLWDEDDKWLPMSIASLETILENYLNPQLGVARYAKVRKNIAYNLQMLEYIHESLETLQLTGVLRTLNFKMFIVCTGGIIEALLYCALKSQNLQTTSDLIEEKKASTSLTVNSQQMKAQTTFFKVVTPYDTDMTFEIMIRKAERNDLWGTGANLYSDLQKVRKLRNKVHLHVEDHSSTFDTDWYHFNLNEYNHTRKTLWEVLVKVLDTAVRGNTRFKYLYA